VFVIILVCVAGKLWADGGGIVARWEDGGVTMTIFSNPYPPRVGAVDFGVLAQESATGKPLDRGVVRVAVSRADAIGQEEGWPVVCNSLNGLGLSGEALRMNSSNKLLHSVVLGVPAAGVWELRVTVVRDGHEAGLTKVIEVAPAGGVFWDFWPLIAMVPAAVGLYSIRGRLISGRRARNLR
jgi:hypothetical protein